MKVKHNTMLLLVICLLSCSNAATMKRRKIKKLEPILTLIVITAVIALTGGVEAKKVKDSSRKKMVKMYSEYLNKLEGIKRFFLNSILPICAYAINATTLNSGLLFQFKFRLEKLKHSLIPGESKPPAYHEESIEDLIKKAEKNIETNKNKSKDKVIEDLRTKLSSDLGEKFDKIKEEIERIVDFDVRIKDSICFDNAQVNALAKSQTEAFQKLNDTAKQLEDTSNFIQLFRNDKKSLEYRETWLENLEKYAPDEKESVKDKINNNSSIKRVLKGFIYVLDLITPLLGDNVQHILKEIKTFYFITQVKSFKQAVGLIKASLTKIAVKLAVQKVATLVLGPIGNAALPMVGAFMSVKSIIDSKKEVRKLEEEIEDRVKKEKIDSENAFRMQSMQVSNMGHNSILCFRMLKMLINSSFKINVQVKGGLEKNENILRLCKQNYYLCQAEMEKVNILEIFPRVKVCSKDIFISKDGVDIILTKNRFVPSNKINHKSAKIYENLFFSTSDSSIVEMKQGPKITKEKVKEAFLNKIKQIHGYDANKCKDIEEHISIQELNLSDDKIVFIKVKDHFIEECEVLAANHCYRLENIINQKSTLSARRSIDDINLTKSITKHNKILTTIKDDQKELELDLIGSVCELIEQPLKVFSEREKRDIRKALSKYLPGLPDADLRSNSTKYSKLLANFLKPIKLNDSSFIINILDGMLVLFNKVINEKTVVLSFDEHQRSIVEFQMKDYSEDNEAELLSYYSRGNRHCIDSQIIKKSKIRRMRYRSSIEILKLHQNGWFTKDKPGVGTDSKIGEITKDERKQLEKLVDEHEIDYIAPFFSGFDYERHSYKLGISSVNYDFDIGNLVNDEMFEKKGDNIRLRSDFRGFTGCKYTFQFIKVEMSGAIHARGHKFEIEHIKGSLFPKLKISKAEEGELAFKPHFYVLLHTSGPRVTDNEVIAKESISMSIHKKLAKFNYFGLNQMTEGSKKDAGEVKITRNKLFFSSDQGKLSVEVFAAPIAHKASTENGTVCDNIQKNKK